MNNKKNLEYRYYKRDRNGEDQYIGSLIEKRINSDRITHASIMNYSKQWAHREVLEDRVYFVRAEV